MFACRSCGGARFAPVIDLGRTPLANALVEPNASDAPESRYPLETVLCRDAG